MDEPKREDEQTLKTIEAEVARLLKEREEQRPGWTRWLAWTGAGVILAVPTIGLGLPERNIFNRGELISASDVNENFRRLWEQVEVHESYESRIATLEGQASSRPRLELQRHEFVSDRCYTGTADLDPRTGWTFVKCSVNSGDCDIVRDSAGWRAKVNSGPCRIDCLAARTEGGDIEVAVDVRTETLGSDVCY